MNKFLKDLSKTIGLTCILASSVSTLPVFAAQMSFDETVSDSSLDTPLVSESCALHSKSNLSYQPSGDYQQNPRLNLGPNLLANSDLGTMQGSPMLANPSLDSDCCAVGGIEAVGGPVFNGGAFCDMGGVPPAGGVVASTPGGFPFPVLAALAPAAGVPLLLSGGESSTPAVPLSSGPKSSSASSPTSGPKGNPSSNSTSGPKGNLASNPSPGPKGNLAANPTSGPKGNLASNPGSTTNPGPKANSGSNPTPGPSVPPSGPVSPTSGSSTEKAPEPSTMAGLLIGGAMFGAYRKRKRNSGVR